MTEKTCKHNKFFTVYISTYVNASNNIQWKWIETSIFIKAIIKQSAFKNRTKKILLTMGTDGGIFYKSIPVDIISNEKLHYFDL